MNIRKVSIVLAVLIVVGAIIASRFLASSTGEKKKIEAPKEALREVGIIQVKNSTLQAPITVTGRLVSPDKVEVFAEVGGVLNQNSRRFKEGNVFTRGSVMISINNEEARFNLLAQKSALLNALTQAMPDLKLDYPEAFPKWKTYLDNFDVDKAIQELPKTDTPKEKYYMTTRSIYDQYYTIKSSEARLRKYFIYAPFTGVVTEANINPGSLVRTGQKLGEFVKSGGYELEASMNTNELDFIEIGDQVSIFSEDISGQWQGTITRINNRVDPNSQTVKTYITVSGARLKENMFMRAEITADPLKNVMAIPRNLLVNGNKVYVVQKGILTLQEVRVLRFRGNEAIVSGLKDGTALVKEASKDYFEGMKVRAI